ncbi:MAG: ABC transporter substrate-binding protein [Pseudomonadota bacterium]
MRFLALFTATFLAAAPAIAGDRILGLGGSIIEIIYALGEEDRLVARDQTARYPAAAVDLPDVGYVRRLSPEGVLSVTPDLIVAIEGSGPPETIELLKEASIPFVEVPEADTKEGVIAKITAVGDALNVPEKAAALAADVRTALDAAEARVDEKAGSPKRVLFILSTRGGRITAGGAGTRADAIIRMSGGINAAADADGWKQLSDEAISAAVPDVLLLMARDGGHGAAVKELLAIPSISVTPAAKSKSVVYMDGAYLLGFGPRTADAINDLSSALYGD